MSRDDLALLLGILSDIEEATATPNWADRARSFSKARFRIGEAIRALDKDKGNG